MRPPSSSTAMRTTAHGDEDYILRGHPIQEAPPPAPGVETLADLFETQAQRQPTAPLFSFAHPQPGKSPTTVSYGQAYQRTLAASQRLFSLLDRQQGAVVGVWLERSIELHLALLGVAFSGAGWLPFDADAPAARVRVCLQDSKAAIILCDQAHLQAAKEAVQGSGAAVVTWDELQQGATVESVRPCRPQGIDTAYMIYTSGSTGTPKGIAISHGAALTFALSEQSILRTGSNDVVWQGFSAAFDMFIEETWVSIAGGAHLVVGSRDECRNVSGLGGADGLWAQRGVTVVNAVPTLINIMTSLDDDARLPASVRLLNLGGEACPGALVGRLWHKDLRIINTYGPSETTVTATFQELLPGQIVTIGKPLPGYHALLLPITDDYAGKEVPTGPVMLAAGAEGELCIGGPCLAKGYVGREALTAEKFVAHPCVTCEGERMYRTGDRVRLDSDLNLLFLGRIDTQVKHRGFRIELGEIESALSAHDDVQTAAVILSDVTARLEAYVVGKRAVEVASLRRSLAALPTYMQPEAFFFLAADEMPRLPSGKINAKALQLTSQSMASASGEGEKAVDLDVDESSPLGVLLRALSAVFPQAGQVLPTSDFFDDLGGHSLAAAMLVSKLRKESGPDSPLASLGLQDIYRCRTAQHLVDKFAADDDDDYDDMHDREGSKKHTGAYLAGGATGQKTGELWPVSRRAHVLCGIAQLPALLLLFFFSSVELLVPYVVFFYVLRERNVGDAILATYAAFAVIPPLMTLVGIAGKWLVLGRAKAGEYPLYGVYYYRFWLAERFVDLIKFDFVADSPLHPSLMRILGAHVGTFCHIGSVDVGAAYDLVDIGHDVVIGQDVTLATSVVERGRLILKHIRIESDAHIASSCVLEGGACVLDGGELAPLSMLADGATVPPFQRWHGSPATFLCDSAHAGLERATRPSLTRKVLLGLSMAFSAWFLFPILYFAPQIPSLLLFEVLDIRTIDAWAQTAAVAMPASLAYILLVFAEMVAFRWLILGTVKPGSHGTTSLYYFRHWFVQNLMTMSLDILKPVYATVYVVPFLRSLGVKIGTWAEVSTARGVQFGLTEIGDESFIADKVLMGSTSIRGNALHLEKTVLSARAFAGNNAVIPQGTRLGSNSLVGVMSIAPDQKTPLQDGQSCFGSPPVLMPARQQDHAGHADHLLYNPRPSQVAHRLLIEGLRIWLPRAIIVFGLGFGLQICEVGFDSIGALYTLLMLPLFYIFLFALPALLFTILVKWTLIGRYSTAEWPLWSRSVWLSEFVTSVHETLLYPLLIRKLVGTPLLPMCFRLLGVKIGARVTMLSSTLTEYDMITLGDEAVLNHHTGPQTHLFEDRIMKVGTVELEARACMKPNSICLPNSRIACDGQLGSLSLLMKGESIPASQAWEGAPIAPRRDRRRSPFAPLEHSESSENNSTSTLAAPRPKGDGSRSASKATAKTLVGDAQTDKEKASDEV